MSQQDREQQSLESRTESAEGAPAGDADPEDDDTPSPFDHPAFLPVLLWGLALWFGYDGWFNENIEAVDFNRYGFGVLVLAGLYYTVQAVREMRARDAGSADS